MQVAVTGGSGSIGKKLIPELLEQGFSITVIGRNSKKIIDIFGSKVTAITWDDLHKMPNPHYIVHLAGHNIGSCLWTKRNMRIAFDSRINTATLLTKYCQAQQINPNIIHASGVTYYGFYNDFSVTCTESTPAHITNKKFSQQLALACEKSFPGMNKASLRLGVVLDPKSGIMPKLVIPAKFGLASVIGSGTQPISWIAMEDVVTAILYIMQHNIRGPINLTSPAAISQANFTKAIAKALSKPLFLTIPNCIIKTITGEFGEQFILNGQNALPDKLIAHGFKYEYDVLSDWLADNY